MGTFPALLWDFPCCVLDGVCRSEVGVVFRCEKNSKRVYYNNNNNDDYLERLTRTGPKRLHVLYKYILSKFNAYNMNAHTHKHTHTH